MCSFVALLSGERFGSGLIVDGSLLRGGQGGAGELHVLDLVDGVAAPTTINRLNKTELIRLRGPRRTVEEVEPRHRRMVRLVEPPPYGGVLRLRAFVAQVASTTVLTSYV